ncbi:MAG: Mg2 transporter protein CorA family protein magnesium transporter [Parcubacteria group bacterium]|nr:Mg2 transporter protein CorA family protein magnesium transporter [Parcubacteria group bacterium]
MLKKKSSKGATWIDLESPTEEEVRQAAEEAGVPIETAEDLLSPTSKHKIEFGENHAYLVLHFPSFKESRDGDAAFEVDFLITASTIITAHYGHVDVFDKIEIENDSESEKELFFTILGKLLENFERKLSSIDHWVRDIEKKMFSGKEKEAIFALSEASRHLTDFKKITAVYPDTFESLKKGGEKIFGKKFALGTSALSERSNKASTKLAVLSEWASELRETNSALLGIKQNETMKVLTVLTFISDVIIGGALIYLALNGH